MWCTCKGTRRSEQGARGKHTHKQPSVQNKVHPTYLWRDHADDIVQGLVIGVCLSDADPVAEVGDKLHLGELVDKVARDPGRVQVALAMRLMEHFKACCCS